MKLSWPFILGREVRGKTGRGQTQNTVLKAERLGANNGSF